MAGSYSRYQNSVTNTRTVVIDTVDTYNKVVQGSDIIGTPFSISVRIANGVFTWPKEGEQWDIEQTNGYWNLLGRRPNPELDVFPIEYASPGATLIGGAPVLVNGKDIVRSHTSRHGDGRNTRFLVNHGLGTRNVFVSGVPADPITSVLSQPLNSGATIMRLEDTSLFPASGRVYLDFEYIEYTHKDATSLYGLIRSDEYASYEAGHVVDCPTAHARLVYHIVNDDSVEVSTGPKVWDRYSLEINVIG